MKNNQSEAGFTLTEVLVTIAIVAIAAAVSLPSIGKRSGERQLTDLSQRISSALRMTRDSAMSSNREQRLVLDLELRAVTWPGGATIELPVAVEATTMSGAGDGSSQSATFRFFPDGGSTGGRIVLKIDGASREIALNWLTGAVAIEHGN